MRAETDLDRQINRLTRLRKDELVGYILLMELAQEKRPYHIVHPSIDTKTKYEIVVDASSSRIAVYWKLFRFVIDVMKRLA